MGRYTNIACLVCVYVHPLTCRVAVATSVCSQLSPSSKVYFPCGRNCSYNCLGTEGHGSFWVRGKHCYGYDVIRIVRCRQVVWCCQQTYVKILSMWLSMVETNSWKFLEVNFRKFGISEIGEWKIILSWTLNGNRSWDVGDGTFVIAVRIFGTSFLTEGTILPRFSRMF